MSGTVIANTSVGPHMQKLPERRSRKRQTTRALRDSHAYTHYYNAKREQRRLYLAMRKLRGWGAEPVAADSDIAPLLECYRHTRDKGNGVPYLLYPYRGMND